MHNKKNIYIKLFTSTFHLSAFTFGGGYVIVPLMKKRFVEQFQWIEEEEMLDLIAIAQSSPGAIAINAAILVGYRMAGILGAMLTVLGTVLPPLLLISAISIVYSFLRDNLFVNVILKGMQAGVAAVIIDVVITMSRGIIGERRVLPILIMLVAFVAAFVLNISVIWIIIISGMIGAGSIYWKKYRQKRGDK